MNKQRFGRCIVGAFATVATTAGLLAVACCDSSRSVAAGDTPPAQTRAPISNPFAGVTTAPTDPILGYTGRSGFILVNANTWAAGAFLVCHNILTGQTDLVPTAFTLEGADFVNGHSGHTYLSNLDATKYTAREIFVSNDPDLWTGLYPTFCKTASGSWLQADLSNRTLLATAHSQSQHIMQRRDGY
jgi:hypothetical protein